MPNLISLFSKSESLLFSLFLFIYILILIFLTTFVAIMKLRLNCYLEKGNIICLPTVLKGILIFKHVWIECKKIMKAIAKLKISSIDCTISYARNVTLFCMIIVCSVVAFIVY